MQIHDVTLREGEQRSGQSYTVDQKVQGASVLDDLGVDAIQVGFPAARDGTKEVCAQLEVDADVTGMARAVERDVDAAIDAGVDVIDIGVPASDTQREYILGVDQEELIEKTEAIADYARDSGAEIHISGMDSFRADPAFLEKLISAADTPMFTLLDTVGAATPARVTGHLESIDHDPSSLGVHFHRDLGVATANVLAAAEFGIGKVDVTVGGIGDRVGNAALEEIVVAGAVGPQQLDCGVDAANLIPRCTELLDVLGEDIDPHKPILGRTAFEHESGMHTATMLDEPSVYEAFEPSRFGGNRALLFGPSSGGGAARRVLERAGVANPSEDLQSAFLEQLHELEEHVPLETAIEIASEVDEEFA